MDKPGSRIQESKELREEGRVQGDAIKCGVIVSAQQYNRAGIGLDGVSTEDVMAAVVARKSSLKLQFQCSPVGRVLNYCSIPDQLESGSYGPHDQIHDSKHIIAQVPEPTNRYYHDLFIITATMFRSIASPHPVQLGFSPHERQR
jgi:hypothetical protein